MSIVEVGEGRTMVWLEKKQQDNGIVLVLGGGETSHIGGMIYIEPGREPVTVDLEGHRDLEVMLPIAQAAAEKYQQPVVVTGGIHIENATNDEIQKIIFNCRELAKCI